jgi:hypothetical protein
MRAEGMHKWDASQGGRSRKGPVLAAANQHWEKLGIEAEHDKQLEQRLRPAKSTDEDVTVITKEDCRPLLDGGQGKDDLVLLMALDNTAAQMETGDGSKTSDEEAASSPAAAAGSTKEENGGSTRRAGTRE